MTEREYAQNDKTQKLSTPNLKLKIENYLSKGVTLIELMVVISVVGILSSVMFVDFGGIEKQLALKRAVYQLAQDIRETEEMALGSIANISCSSGKTVCGFGMYFHPAPNDNFYTIFADCANDCQNNNYAKDSGDTEIRQIFLEKTITLQKALPARPLSLIFSAPDPVVWINGINWGEETEITLQTPAGETRKVRVNSAGRVEIE